MNRIYKKEEGVSPVIATILMVAITVVLAATVYIMVAGLGGTGSTPVSGSLTYLSDLSSSNNATFQITLSNPNNPKVSDVHVKVLDSSGNIVSGASWGIIHITSDSTHLKSGDHLYVSGTTFGSGYKVIVSISGYSGTITGTIP